MQYVPIEPKKIVIFLLLFLIFAVRIYRIDYIQFDSDFGRDSLFGWRIITEKLTLLGAQASVGGFYLGPLYFYFIASLYALVGPVPELLMLLFALGNTIAGWIGYKFLSSRINLQAGLIFLLLFSTQPLLVQASRMATHAPMLPLITILAIVALVRSLEKTTVSQSILSGMIMGLFLHVHFSALLLFPGYIFAFAVFTKGIWTKKIMAMLSHSVGIFILISPLILFDLRHHLITSTAFFGYILSVIKGDLIRDAFPHWSIGEKVRGILSYLAPTWNYQLIVLGSGLFGLWSSKKMVTKVTMLLSVSVVIFLLLYSGYLFPYYLIVPGVVVLFTLSIALSQLPQRWIGVTIAGVLCILGIQSLSPLYRPQFRTINNLEQIVSPIQAHLDSLGKKPFNIYKDSSDGLTGLGYEYRFLLTRNSYIPVSEYDYSRTEILYVIREEGSNNPLTLGGHEMSQFGAKEVERIAGLQVHDRQVSIFALYR